MRGRRCGESTGGGGTDPPPALALPRPARHPDRDEHLLHPGSLDLRGGRAHRTRRAAAVPVPRGADHRQQGDDLRARRRGAGGGAGDVHHSCPRLAAGAAARCGHRPGAGQHLRAAAAGRGARGPSDAGVGGTPPRLGGLATACAARAAVQRRRRGAHHPGRLLRRRLLPFRHPGLVQRAGAHGAGRIAPGLARLSGGTPQHHPLRRAGNGQRSGPRGAVLGAGSVHVRLGAGKPDLPARFD